MFDGGGGGGVMSSQNKVAPYAPWPAVRVVLERLRATGVPSGMLRRKDLGGLYAPTVLKQVLAAFRFMGLMDELDRPTQRMHDLVMAYGTSDWSPTLADVLTRSFPEIVGPSLTHATRERLEGAFRVYRESSEDVRKKCVRFFLSAAREAGIPLSAELSEPSRPSSGMRDVRQPQEDGVPELFQNPSPVPPTPSASIPLPQAQQLAEPAWPGPAPQARLDPHRAAFVALKAVWDPGEMPEEVDAAVVTVLRYLRKKEGEATKR